MASEHRSVVRPPLGRGAAAAVLNWGATAALGCLGLASAVFAAVRLFDRWRIAPADTSHQVVLLGQTFSYPAANLAAGVLLVLGMLGVVVLGLAIAGAVAELAASIRFDHRITPSRSTRIEGALVIEDTRALAFCAGLLRPRIYISTGALAALDDPALHAVLRHEQHHVRRRDPLRLAVGRVLSRALFFLPGMATLAREQQSLAELAADEWAVATVPDNRAGLAQALLTLSGQDTPGLSIGIDSARVDHLLGDPNSWRFPAMLCFGTAALLILAAAATTLISQLASGSASLALPLLTSHPCLALLAIAPTATGLMMRRRRTLRRRTLRQA